MNCAHSFPCGRLEMRMLASAARVLRGVRVSRVCRLLFVTWACACGGTVTRDAQPGAGGRTSNNGGSSEVTDASAEDADAGFDDATSGGARANEIPARDSGANDADAPNAGSAGEAPSVTARAKSGRRLCIDDRDCEGLPCTASAGRQNTACLASCVSDADCKVDERFFQSPTLAADTDAGLPAKNCFQRCDETPTVCAFEFDCADYYRTDEYICLPTEWVRNWPPVEP